MKQEILSAWLVRCVSCIFEGVAVLISSPNGATSANAWKQIEFIHFSTRIYSLRFSINQSLPHLLRTASSGLSLQHVMGPIRSEVNRKVSVFFCASTHLNSYDHWCGSAAMCDPGTYLLLWLFHTGNQMCEVWSFLTRTRTQISEETFLYIYFKKSRNIMKKNKQKQKNKHWVWTSRQLRSKNTFS